MILVYLIAAIVAMVAVFKSSVEQSRAATTAPAHPLSNIGQSQIRYTTPRSPTPVAASPSSDYGTGQKPSGIMTGISQITGSVTVYTSNASEMRGIAIDGTVLFDQTNLVDGHNSATYLAGSILDHINFLGPGGTTRLQVYFATLESSSPSEGLVDTSMVPVGQTAKTDSSGLPYPAGDPAYNLPSPSVNGAVNPEWSWYDRNPQFGGV